MRENDSWKDLAAAMRAAIVDGEEQAAAALAAQGLDQGLSPLDILEQGFFPGMQEVGEKFERCELWLPEVMLAAEAMEAAVAVLQEPLASCGEAGAGQGVVVLGTAKGDVHDIGKNIFRTMLTANGFTVHDLGKDVAPETFISRAQEVGAAVIAISALMTSTMLYMPEVIQKLVEKGLRDRFRVVVGGAPVVESWAREIGADGYAPTASEGVMLLRQWNQGTTAERRENQ